MIFIPASTTRLAQGILFGFRDVHGSNVVIRVDSSRSKKRRSRPNRRRIINYMDSPFSPKNYIPSQITKLREETNIKTIIAAEDGSIIKISDFL